MSFDSYKLLREIRQFVKITALNSNKEVLCLELKVSNRKDDETLSSTVIGELNLNPGESTVFDLDLGHQPGERYNDLSQGFIRAARRGPEHCVNLLNPYLEVELAGVPKGTDDGYHVSFSKFPMSV